MANIVYRDNAFEPIDWKYLDIDTEIQYKENEFGTIIMASSVEEAVREGA